jgi:tetratricopeptide (TPR) repeat protein
VAEAEAAGELPALAEALRVRDWAKMELGRTDAPVDSERALGIYEELGDLHGQSSTTNLLGMSAYWRGDWSAALDFYRRSLAIARRAGNPMKVAFQQFNIGEIALDQGHLDEAEEQFVEVEREWRAAGYRAGVASVSAMLARVAEGRRDFDGARRRLDHAVAEFRAIGSQADALETEARIAELLVVSGDVPAALDAAEAGIAQARALGGVSAQLPLLHRVRGAALARAGDVQGSRSALADSLDAARHRDAEHDVALTLQTLAAVLAGDGDPDADAQAAHADVVLDRLGIVRVPDLLGQASSVGDAPSG